MYWSNSYNTSPELGARYLKSSLVRMHRALPFISNLLSSVCRREYSFSAHLSQWMTSSLLHSEGWILSLPGSLKISPSLMGVCLAWGGNEAVTTELEEPTVTLPWGKEIKHITGWKFPAVLLLLWKDLHHGKHCSDSSTRMNLWLPETVLEARDPLPLSPLPFFF